MTRLEPVSGPEGLDAAQQALWDNVTGGRRHLEGEPPPRSLDGPFNPWMYAAGGGMHAARLGEYLRYEGVIDDRLREIAILTVATFYRAEFEYAHHAQIARAVGLPAATVDAIAAARPELDDRDDGPRGSDIVYRAVGQLLRSGRIDDTLFGKVKELLGTRGLVELVMTTGYYALVSMTLNTFDVPVPEGSTERSLRRS